MSSSDFILQHASEEKYEVSGPTHKGRGEGGVWGVGGWRWSAVMGAFLTAGFQTSCCHIRHLQSGIICYELESLTSPCSNSNKVPLYTTRTKCCCTPLEQSAAVHHSNKVPLYTTRTKCRYTPLEQSAAVHHCTPLERSAAVHHSNKVLLYTTRTKCCCTPGYR